MNELAEQIEPRRCVGEGCAEVTFAHGADRTILTHLRAQSPLRLLTPRTMHPSAWVYTSTFGGGMLAGDRYRVRLTAENGAVGFVGTQSSNKVYRSDSGADASCVTDIRVRRGATLIVAPDPLVCFAGARYAQKISCDLAADGGLVLLDWYTSGRMARGEVWSFNRLSSCISIHVDGRLRLYDPLLIERGTAGPFCHGAFNSFGTLIIAGQQLAAAAHALHERIAKQAIAPRGRVLVSCSPFAHGVVLRLAAVQTYDASLAMQDYLSFLPPILGEHPWARRL